MPISTIKISDSIEFCKRLSFNRNPVIGNSLEPARTAANLVMQTILSPPFSWWWNNEVVTFNCRTALRTATISSVTVASNVVSITIAAGEFVAGDIVILSGVTSATYLNGISLVLLTASATTLTAAFTHANAGPTATVGTVSDVTTQDYAVQMSDFSHIDYANVFDTNQTPNKWYQLKVQDTLALDSVRARPQFINPNTQDSNGIVTFRLMPAPNLAYPVVVQAQMAAPLITSMEDTWAPIPDYMEYIYNWGFLALMYMFCDDPRFAIANQKFTSGLLARAQGLSEQEKNIFMNNWNALTGQDQARIQQGMQARQV